MIAAHLQVVVGRNLRAARKAAGLTLKQLAPLTGISFSYLSRVEKGEKNLTLSTISTIATALGVNVAGLMADADVS